MCIAGGVQSIGRPPIQASATHKPWKLFNNNNLILHLVTAVNQQQCKQNVIIFAVHRDKEKERKTKQLNHFILQLGRVFFSYPDRMYKIHSENRPHKDITRYADNII